MKGGGITWRKAPEHMVAMFAELVAVLPPDVEPRKMFGFPCVFVNNQLFAGLHQEHLMLRLSDADRQAFLSIPGAAQFEPMPGRPMREYVVAPEVMLNNHTELLAWLEKSCAYARTVPAKAPKKKAR